MTAQCQICGVDLKDQDNPLAWLAAWPTMLLPGHVPGDDELCRKCLSDLGRSDV